MLYRLSDKVSFKTEETYINFSCRCLHLWIVLAKLSPVSLFVEKLFNQSKRLFEDLPTYIVEGDCIQYHSFF